MEKVPNNFKDHSEEKLVKAGAKEEGEQLSHILRGVISPNSLQVHVSVQKAVDWLIPQPIELFKCSGVPPVQIELPISKPRQLGEYVGDVLEYHVEEEDAHDEERQDGPTEELPEGYMVSHLDVHHDVVCVDYVGCQYP